MTPSNNTGPRKRNFEWDWYENDERYVPYDQETEYDNREEEEDLYADDGQEEF